jgi:hypothetical protein
MSDCSDKNKKGLQGVLWLISAVILMQFGEYIYFAIIGLYAIVSLSMFIILIRPYVYCIIESNNRF